MSKGIEFNGYESYNEANGCGVALAKAKAGQMNEIRGCVRRVG